MYFYHAHAIALGGRIGSTPLNVEQGSCALAVTGGEAEAKKVSFSDDGITFQSSDCKVAGGLTYPRGLNVWTTEASVVIQKLNLFGRVTADTIEARINSEYRAGDYEASTVISRSKFDNLQIDGKPLQIETSEDLSWRYPTFGSMDTDFQNEFSKPWVLATLVGRGLDVKTANTPDLRDAFDSYGEQNSLPSLKSLVLCSFVTKISGGGFNSWGPIVAIPDLGDLYLGEVIVWPWMRCLTMFRLALRDKDGKPSGAVSGGSAGTGGGTWPPGAYGGGGT